MNTKAHHIIHAALDKFRQLTEIEGKWTASEPGEAGDGRVMFNKELNGKTFETEIKNEVRNHHLESLLKAESAANAPFLLVAGTIYPSAKEYLKKHGLNYLDIAGNTFIQNGDTFIFIEGQKWKDDTHPEALNRAFTKTGLRITFILLKDRLAVNYPVRTLAGLAGVSIGAVNSAKNGLRTMTFIGKATKNEYRIDLRETLIERWVSGYQERLKPDLLLGTFKRIDDWENRRLDGQSYWGGEAAAWKLRGALVPKTLTVYTDESRIEFMKRHRLIPDPDGEFLLYKKFWHDSMLTPYTGVVPPLLVYADLMDTLDPRCIEEARKIYKDI